MTTTTSAPERALPYRYFVAFQTPVGCGNTEVKLERPIRSLADIRLVEQLILDGATPDVTNVFVVNYRPFDATEGGGPR